MTKNNLIVKANQVIEASYSLTTIEQRLILSAIAQIPKGEEVSDDVLYPVSTENLVKLGGDKKISHQDFKDAVNRLYERSIVLKNSEQSDSFRWIQQKSFKSSNIALVRFSQPILPFLSNLKAEFTKYLESDIVGMSSPYAIRFYELMMQYRSVGHREISLNDLRWMFQLENKYPVWADLKKRVIDQATKEINQYSPYELMIEPIRQGRKIESIKLKFKEKPLQGLQKTKTIPKSQEQLQPLTEPQIAKYSAILCKLGSLSELAGTMDYPAFANWLGNILRDPKNCNQETVKRVFKALKTETDYSKSKT